MENHYISVLEYYIYILQNRKMKKIKENDKDKIIELQN